MRELDVDPVAKLAEKALARCTSRDWRDALRAARFIVEEARIEQAPRVPGKEQLTVLVALRMIQYWMAHPARPSGFRETGRR